MPSDLQSLSHNPRRWFHYQCFIEKEATVLSLSETCVSIHRELVVKPQLNPWSSQLWSPTQISHQSTLASCYNSLPLCSLGQCWPKDWWGWDSLEVLQCHRQHRTGANHGHHVCCHCHSRPTCLSFRAFFSPPCPLLVNCCQVQHSYDTFFEELSTSRKIYLSNPQPFLWSSIHF